ncbi:hypothetical protein K466DRAFT_582280 [Polyporus arcularius HHB13444]|uniref:Uncharacterized protein n=1 Tax=Polyporus arcularius HHB13444 TaxID=1314778 RepID=A0A5C3PQG8_9APHY|nr:hypothetical protein K466DRAFT_582280 [Polyporus arcularius HHB13444]
MPAFRNFALVAAAVAVQLAGTTAQSLSISSQCQSTLAALVTSSDASCLNAQALVGLVASSSSSSNTSIVSSVNTWATGLCSKPACSNDTLAAVVSNITSGCSADLQSLGLSNIDAGELTSIVQTAYPTVRQVLCLADTSNSNTLCVTEALKSIEPYTGALSVSNIESIATGIMGGGAIPSIPTNLTCTDCVKGAYSIVSQNFGDLIPSSVSSDLSSTCGASFVDGALPSTVTQLATKDGSSTTVTPNGAAPSFAAVPVFGIVAASLLAVSSAFALLA